MADDIRINIDSDVDMVPARQEGRELAGRLGFSRTDATLIATAISEIARNIIVHVGSGEIVLSPVFEEGRAGIVVIARDSGPGIADIAAAMQDGHGAEGGMGLGLPGSRRLMDEFHIDSEIGVGTTVTMKKWKASDASRG